MLNTSLAGVVDEAVRSGAFGRVYGAYRGLEGLLDGQVSDLTDVSPSTWKRVARTPGAVLGSTRRKLAPGDVPVILDLLARHKIGYWFLIGGNDSALTGHALSDEAARAGYDLAVVNIPKTVDNDLVLTDHCPGYWQRRSIRRTGDHGFRSGRRGDGPGLPHHHNRGHGAGCRLVGRSVWPSEAGGARRASPDLRSRGAGGRRLVRRSNRGRVRQIWVCRGRCVRKRPGSRRRLGWAVRAIVRRRFRPSLLRRACQISGRPRQSTPGRPRALREARNDPALVHPNDLDFRYAGGGAGGTRRRAGSARWPPGRDGNAGARGRPALHPAPPGWRPSSRSRGRSGRCPGSTWTRMADS